jgi:hypothetical protein
MFKSENIRKVVAYLIMVFIICSCVSTREVHLELLESKSGYSYGAQITDSIYIQVFLVHRYRDNQETERIIDEFACEQAANYFSQNNGQIFVDFYRASRRMNPRYLSKHPEYFDVDAIYNEFLWSYSYKDSVGLLSKTKPKNTTGYKFYYERPECNLD